MKQIMSRRPSIFLGIKKIMIDLKFLDVDWIIIIILFENDNKLVIAKSLQKLWFYSWLVDWTILHQ